MRAKVQPAGDPVTRSSIAADLRALGLAAGDVVLVHSSLSAIGWVPGGPVPVLQGLQDVLTDAGTVVMPAHTSGLTDPERWANPPVPAEWRPVIREQIPAFDPVRTPSEHMGVIAETFRTWPGVRRSAHPHVSFAAWGAQADQITQDHGLAWSLGEGSPLARVYDLNGKILLIGTTQCTSLHLAEARAGQVAKVREGGPVLDQGVRRWVTFEDWDYDDGPFDDLLDGFCRAHDVRPGKVGAASTLLLEQRALVDFAHQALAN